MATEKTYETIDEKRIKQVLLQLHRPMVEDNDDCKQQVMGLVEKVIKNPPLAFDQAISAYLEKCGQSKTTFNEYRSMAYGAMVGVALALGSGYVEKFELDSWVLVDKKTGKTTNHK